MINEQLINPQSIVVIGASDNLQKPGGKILYNILECYRGIIYTVNPKKDVVQGVKTFSDVSELPEEIDLAIIAIAAKYCVETVRQLAEEKGIKAIIILSAGFSEENEVGAQYEKEILDIVNKNDVCLIGPNCIGVININHHSIFTEPIPALSPKGADFISGSGATAVFILETAVSLGLKFNSVYSVGNSTQIGVEDVLEYLDLSFNEETDSKIKLLYIESIKNPDKLLKHANSLVHKGCKIAAIKSGSSQAGMRAAASHTGALAGSDVAVDALFRKAGIVRCYGRLELATVGAVFMAKEMTGKNVAIVTHAGGPAVMLTDALARGGLSIPEISGVKADKLKSKLFAGSSVSNPIDFLSTGTAEQLELIIDACEKDFDNIDAMAVIFGSPGLFPVREVYNVLSRKMAECSKPIYPILPSVVNAEDDIKYFISQGNVNFSDEVMLGSALTKVYNSISPAVESIQLKGVNIPTIRKLINQFDEGFLEPKQIRDLFDAAGIPMVKEYILRTKDEALALADDLPYPLAMKVIGVVHKTEVNGVALNIMDKLAMEHEFSRLIEIERAKGVQVQPMIKGVELFVGAKYEPKYGHVILCGVGGIFVEILKDVASGLAPLTEEEALNMIESIKSKKILEGARNQPSVDKKKFAEIIVRLSTMLRFATEIVEIDINPLIGIESDICAVDAVVKIKK